MNKQRYIIINKDIRARASAAVMAIRGEDNVEVIIQPHVNTKTAEQRAWFHVLCGLFGEATGYTREEIKELVKAEIIGTTVITIAGREREVTASSEKQNRAQYSELIEGCYRLAAEAGVVLPNPGRSE